MNPFEGENIQCSRNQASDAAVGFFTSFLAFAIIFAVSVIVDYVSM